MSYKFIKKEKERNVVEASTRKTSMNKTHKTNIKTIQN